MWLQLYRSEKGIDDFETKKVIRKTNKFNILIGLLNAEPSNQFSVGWGQAHDRQNLVDYNSRYEEYRSLLTFNILLLQFNNLLGFSQLLQIVFVGLNISGGKIIADSGIHHSRNTNIPGDWVVFRHSLAFSHIRIEDILIFLMSKSRK